MKIMPFFGWCHEIDAKTGRVSHDKIWGYIKAQGEFITFWGRRDKKLSFKRGSDYPNLDKTAREKSAKGYRDTTMEEMNSLDPEFETRFEEGLILVMMGNTFHRNPYEGK